jgi:hypothetical protein
MEKHTVSNLRQLAEKGSSKFLWNGDNNLPDYKVDLIMTPHHYENQQ